MTKIEFTKSGVELVVEVLAKFIDNYGADADADGEDPAERKWAADVLAAKTVLASIKKQVGV